MIPVDLSHSAPHAWSADKGLVKEVREAFGGIGPDVAMEMAGFNSSVNNAIQSALTGDKSAAEALGEAQAAAVRLLKAYQ